MERNGPESFEIKGIEELLGEVEDIDQYTIDEMRGLVLDLASWLRRTSTECDQYKLAYLTVAAEAQKLQATVGSVIENVERTLR